MNNYKEFLNKEVSVVYKFSNSVINLRTKGILIADNGVEIVIRCTGEVNKGITKVIEYEDLISVEKIKI